MGFRYEPRLPDGDDAGTFETSASDWRVGDTLGPDGPASLAAPLEGFRRGSWNRLFCGPDSFLDRGAMTRVRRRPQALSPEACRLDPLPTTGLSRWG